MKSGPRGAGQQEVWVTVGKQSEREDQIEWGQRGCGVELLEARAVAKARPSL